VIDRASNDSFGRVGRRKRRAGVSEEMRLFFTTFGPLIGAIVGGLLVWVGTYMADRRKVQAENRAALRAAYADWLTAITVLPHEFRALEIVIEDLQAKRTKYKPALAEVKAILPLVKDGAHAYHKVYLLDLDSTRIEHLRVVTYGLEVIYHGLQALLEGIRRQVRLTERVAQARLILLDPEISEDTKKKHQKRLDEAIEYANNSSESLAKLAASLSESPKKSITAVEGGLKLTLPLLRGRI
jgi:hypothetical protein